MTSGERLPLIVGEGGLPLPPPNQWSLFIRRLQVQQNNLIEELHTVAHVYDWAARRALNSTDGSRQATDLRRPNRPRCSKIFGINGRSDVERRREV
jgi:hypothetical protein